METLHQKVADCVAEYLEAPEAWEGAQICITPDGSVSLAPEEEADTLPEDVDIYDILEFIKMTPDGEWIADSEAIGLL